jgi:HTH-type transcriptional regulator / antitoxin HipB
MKTMDNKQDNYEEHLEVEMDQIQSAKFDENILGFEISKLGEVIKEIRENQHLTREELAQKCGTSSYYISKIENNMLDIPISALSSIVRQGLNGHLELRVRL